ncbi:hypothetical protein JW835_08040 [bacterium]|nr:hypothetical protein [bacterium]
MKNVLIGCGVILAIVVIIVIFIGYFSVKFFKDIKEDIVVYQGSFQELNSKYPFEEPEDGLIGSDQFQRWLQVRGNMTASIAGYDTIAQRFSLKSFQKFKKHTLSVIEKLVTSLDSIGLSPQEYIWMSRQIVGALQSGDIRYDSDLQDVSLAFDSMVNKEGSRGNRTNLDDLAVPVTSEQISRIASLIRSNKEVFIETMKVFYADMAIHGFVNVEFGPDENELEDTEQTALFPAASPEFIVL